MFDERGKDAGKFRPQIIAHPPRFSASFDYLVERRALLIRELGLSLAT